MPTTACKTCCHSPSFSALIACYISTVKRHTPPPLGPPTPKNNIPLPFTSATSCNGGYTCILLARLCFWPESGCLHEPTLFWDFWTGYKSCTELHFLNADRTRNSNTHGPLLKLFSNTGLIYLAFFKIESWRKAVVPSGGDATHCRVTFMFLDQSRLVQMCVCGRSWNESWQIRQETCGPQRQIIQDQDAERGRVINPYKQHV